jgi:hypothetical protein
VTFAAVSKSAAQTQRHGGVFMIHLGKAANDIKSVNNFGAATGDSCDAYHPSHFSPGNARFYGGGAVERNVRCL